MSFNWLNNINRHVSWINHNYCTSSKPCRILWATVWSDRHTQTFAVPSTSLFVSVGCSSCRGSLPILFSLLVGKSISSSLSSLSSSSSSLFGRRCNEVLCVQAPLHIQQVILNQSIWQFRGGEGKQFVMMLMKTWNQSALFLSIKFESDDVMTDFLDRLLILKSHR